MGSYNLYYMHYDYDLIVIGAGSAGLSAAGIAASLGVKTLLVEADRFGGDCTWTGCVPSKTLLAEAKKIYMASQVTDQPAQELIDFEDIMDRLENVQEGIYAEADSPESLQRFGVDTRRAHARIQDRHTVQLVSGHTDEKATAKYIFIATGASPIIPPINGLQAVDYHTSETIFTMDEQPECMIIIGAGPIGVEISQAFTRLGTTVHLVEADDSILPTDSPLTAQLQRVLQDEGIRVHTNARVTAAEQSGKDIEIQTNQSDTFAGDTLLVAAGRSPNTEDIGLDNIGITASDGGIDVSGHGQTSVNNIYAIGDVTGGSQFTHQSEQEAKMAVFRSLFKLPLSSKNPVPRVTYTDPEHAVVGQSSKQLETGNVAHDTYSFPYEKLDRAVTDNQTEGGVQLVTNANSSTLVGAEVLGPRAGELISELGLAIANSVSVQDMAQTVHPYPSYGLGVRRAADQYMAQNQPTWLLRVVKKLFGYRGSLYEPDTDEIV